MNLTINPIFQEASTAYKEGKLDDAERLYRKILKTHPKIPEVNHNLGLILCSKDKIADALLLFKMSTEVNPNIENFWISYINTLIGDNQLDKAETISRKTIELKPDFAIVHGNLGTLLLKLKRFEEAVVCLKKSIELHPALADAHYNLGKTLRKLERFDEAEASYRQAITLKPEFPLTHNNLGVILSELKRFDEAEASYRQAITLKPDYAEAYNNLGNMLKELERFDEAEASCGQAITLKPDYAEAHNNLGFILEEKGDLVAAINTYKKALNIQPDYDATWINIFFALQAIKSQTSSIEEYLPLLDKKTTSKYAQIAKSILSYSLNRGSPSTESYLDKALSIMSSADNIFIKNPKVSSTELIKPILPKKITAMIVFGRSGTGLLHSLIDGHPEVSTLPATYFGEFFDDSIWKEIIAGGWEEMADRFASTYRVLFDASSPIIPTSKSKLPTNNIGKKEGMMNVGMEKDEVLSVDKKKFVNELKQLMDCHDRLDTLTFFKLVHSAYEKTLQNHKEKNHIFYHIHNPDHYAQLNFLRLAPNTSWLMMVREPIQSCESWIRSSFLSNNYREITNKIFQMLFEVDQAVFRNKNSIGVRLEDLKEHPKKTIQALCGWLGIKEKDSLYQMTAGGKKWWGDPGSPDFEKEGMDPFGKTSINRKLGLVFSKNDQFIMRTLFYPFSVQFGYTEENLEQFKNDLEIIRPMLDQMFDFERKIAHNKKIDIEKFMKSGSYLYLRSGMIERWNTLNKFYTYHNMLTPLKIN